MSTSIFKMKFTVPVCNLEFGITGTVPSSTVPGTKLKQIPAVSRASTGTV
jgi:hypothetical protein